MLPISLGLVLIALQLGSSTASVSEAEKKEILDAHNEWRKKAAATAMLKIKWNDELASYAEKAAARCSFEHTTWDQRQGIAGFSYIGENIYVNTAKPTFKEAVDSWGDEIKDFDLASNKCNPGAVCGHYTQITWAKTGDVGCAISQCSGPIQDFGHPGYVIFCNYGVGGNMQGEKPFERGAPGSECQSAFKVSADSDGLCGEGGSSSTGSDAGQTDKPSDGGQADQGEPTIPSDQGRPDQTPTEQPGDDDQPTENDNDNQGNDNSSSSNEESQSNSNEESESGSSESGSQSREDGNGECKDDIWYCYDWLDSCHEEWTTRACRKSCNHC